MGVNHCIAHLEIGIANTGCSDPVLLYASGGNTQVIALAEGRYRIFGETLDIGIGNMFDKLGRKLGLGYYAGPIIERLAGETDVYHELPYSVKGMDVSFSGIMTAALALQEKGVSLPEICNSVQETCFAMLMEVAERAFGLLGTMRETLEKGNPNAATDGLVGLMNCRTAILSALLNVRINLGSITDRAFVDKLTAACDRMEKETMEQEMAAISRLKSKR